MQDLVRLHVPCKLEYTKLVEDFTESISGYIQSADNPQFNQKLRTVMNEVFINVVEHSDTAARNEIVRFQFEIGMKYFSISIYDYGPGFKAEGHYPPYPKNLTGKKFKLRDVIDGTVSYTVVDPFSISFSFEESEEADLDMFDELSNLKEHGLGMSIVTKLMDSVTYSYIGEGKFDWKLIKQLE